MLSFCKRHFHKIISAFCAFIIAISTFVYSFSLSVFASHVGGYYEIHTINAINYLSSLSGSSTYELFNAYDWQEYSDVNFVTATGKYNNLKYDFWYDENHEIQYTMWSGDSIVDSSVDTDNQQNPGSSIGSPGSISASDFKSALADYSSRYAPMPSPDDYIWSYQSNTTLARSGADGFWYFKPDVPVYTYTSGQLGNHGWSDFYVLPFWHESTSNSTYFGKYYYRVWYENVDGTVNLYIDVYSMSDKSFIISKSSAWDIDEYKYLGFMFQRNSYGIRKYASYSDYLTDNGITKFTLSNYYTMLPVTNTGVSTTLNSLLQDSSFEPNLDTNDDWGAYVSNKPFELFANQTSIDFLSIPDNYIITIYGDTIYDYSITNPDTGDSTTIYYYITNDYTIPSSDDPTVDDPTNPSDPTDPTDPSDPTNPCVSGDITVTGNIDVNGEINIKTDPIDININVAGGSDYPLGTLEPVDLTGYLDTLPEQTETMNDYFSTFFKFVPPQFLALLLSGISIAVLCRVLGR